jgi:hypothetical protein
MMDPFAGREPEEATAGGCCRQHVPATRDRFRDHRDGSHLARSRACASISTVTCWAASLGDCGGGISREHIISRSQFDEDTITLQGLPWCKDPRSIGLARLVAKNLCRDHNSALSAADEEARKLKHAFKTMFHKPLLPVRVELDARLIERWLLKTTINLALQEPNSGLEPTPELVRYAFGVDVPPQGQGFFLVAEMGENLGYAEGIRFESTARRDDGRMVIGVFVFHGVRALYAFHGAPAVNGAMRTRRLNMAPHWLKFRWAPDLDPTDKMMR